MRQADRRRAGRRVAAQAFVAGLALTACGLSPRKDPTRYYVLASDAVTTDALVAASADAATTLGVGPFTLPEYLDRSELVRRVGPNEVRPEPASRWGSSLERQFTRALAESLGTRARATNVLAFPWRAADRVDRVLKGHVLRFEATEDGTALLVARWFAADFETGEILASGVFETRVPAAAPGTPAAVAALSEAVDRFAAELATRTAGL